MRVKKINYSVCTTAVAMLFLVLSTASAVHAEESHETGEHAFHRNHAALIVANTFDDHGENGVSAGVDYEYRFNQWFGLGGIVEYAGGDFEHVLLGIPLFIHPVKNWRFAIAAGTEIHKDEEHDERKRETILRIGTSYAFHVGDGYSISPEFNVDFSEHETLYVVGIAFGFGW